MHSKTPVALLMLATVAALLIPSCAADGGGGQRDYHVAATKGHTFGHEAHRDIDRRPWDSQPSGLYRGTRDGMEPAPRPVMPPMPPPPMPPAPPVHMPPPPPPPQMGNTVSMAFPTGDRATSAILLEKSAPAEVRVGEPYTYEIRVTNLTSMPLQGVTVGDAIDGAFSVQSSSPPAQSMGGKMSFNLGTLQPGETKIIRITGTATGTGVITNCADVSYNSLACISTQVVQPQIRITKAAPSDVLSCDPIPLTFTVTNTGSGLARNISVEDNLPDGMVAQDGSNRIMIPVGDLGPGQSREVTVQVQARRSGTFQNQAFAVADGVRAESNITTTTVRTPVLVIQKECPGERYVGRRIEYTITVSNTGDGPARNTMLEDAVPAGTSFAEASDGGQNQGGRVVWNLGTLEPSATRRVTMIVIAQQKGSIQNTATARAYCTEVVSDGCVTEVKGIPAILLEVVDQEDPIEVGTDVTYTITVTNQGSAPDTNVRIGCAIETTGQFVSAQGATNLPAGAAPGQAFTFEPLPVLAPNRTQAVWHVRVKALQPGDTRFKVTLNSDQLGRPVEETESTHFYQ